jgi:NADH dehydrogenase
VVIVGGGFGGLACARKLDGEPVDVLLIDAHNYHMFTPLLYQVATALLNPSDIAYPLRKVFRRSPNVRFRQALVAGVDFQSKAVQAYDGERIPYDRLVLATGSVNDYFGNQAVASHAIGMKHLDEAMRLRNHVLACLERATRSSDPEERREWLTFVVVGGGPTGVEYAGALGELLRLVLGRDYPELTLEESRIVLVEGQDRLLGQFPGRLGQYAARTLAKRGIEVQLSILVHSADDRSVELSTGDRIRTRTVVWSAGVRPLDPLTDAGVRRGRAGRLVVDVHLRVEGLDGVFAIGDAAAAGGGTDADLPMLSPPAMQEGRYVARAIIEEARGRQPDPEPFRYLDKGTMATIGRNSAVAHVRGLRLRGFPGWVAWLAVHIYYLIGFRNRLAVLWSWGWNYVKKDRAIRIIARSQADPLTDELDERDSNLPAHPGGGVARSAGMPKRSS